jgi:predicted ATPase
MLNSLRLHNFKSAKDLPIRMELLTVLAGLNGSGKSTALQAIALLKQSLGVHDSNLRLHLRGSLVQMGRCEDVFFENAVDDEIKFEIGTSQGSIRLVCQRQLGVDTLPLEITGELSLEQLSHNLTHFQYIQADRLVPATQYEYASTPDQEAGWLGCRGEFTVDFLAKHATDKVSEFRAFPHDALGVSEALYKQVAPTDGLIDQTAGWLQQLSPGVLVRTVELESADAVSLRFEYTGVNLDSGGKSRRPSNVGFGLTYSLPVVVACLAAPKGALLLLENPEAHLHPQGQAALGELLARCAADGVQIIVETHSDHVLNGIRLAVKRKLIAESKVVLQYFKRDVESGESSIQTPQILPDGQLMEWPEGFFDQWDRSLDALLE